MDYRELEIQFQELSIPLFDAIANAKNKALPKITVFPDGKVVYEYSEEVNRFVDSCYKRINEMRRNLFDQNT